jgi:hypothetical protein
MEYGKPSKLQDGRYFLRVTSKDDGSRVLKQINNVEMQEANCLKISSSADLLREYDDDILSAAEKHSEEWFGKKVDSEALKKAFDSSINTGLLEAPFAKRGGTVATRVFDVDRKEVSPDVLVPGTKCDVVVELVGLWFLKKSFGPVWRLVQARLKKESTFPNKYMFSDETAEESDDEYYV